MGLKGVAGAGAAEDVDSPCPKLNPEEEGCCTEGIAPPSLFFGTPNVPKLVGNGVCGVWTGVFWVDAPKEKDWFTVGACVSGLPNVEKGPFDTAAGVPNILEAFSGLLTTCIGTLEAGFPKVVELGVDAGMPNLGKLVGWPKLDTLSIDGGDAAATGLKTAAPGLSPGPKIDGVAESPKDLLSGTKRLCSSCWTSTCSVSTSSSTSIHPSRIAWATEVPLITAVNDRR